MASTGLTHRATPYSPYDANEENDEEDYKDHPPPAKQMGQGMILGMVVAALLFISFIVWFEERGPEIDHHLHAKVLKEHAKREESHAILSGMTKDVHAKHARGELPDHIPTKEELENARTHEMLRQMDEDEAMGLHEPDAVGMFDALGNQMQDTKIDLQHRLDVFWDMDKNKDAFITFETDLEHLARRPGNLQEADFTKLDTNKDGAVGIREWVSGFHDSAHMGEPWYHHKYGFVYGTEIPNHFSKARPGAVKMGTAEHKAAKAGLHPAQTEKKLADAKWEIEHKELNEKAHAAEEKEHEEHEKMEAKKRKKK